jgi:hypothetical protein
MKCPMETREGEELLLDYVSGALDTQAAALFEQHMLTCAPCNQFAHQHKAVWGALDIFEPAQISADFDRRLYQRLDRGSWWQRAVAAFGSPLLAHRGLPVAAAAAVLVLAVGLVWERPSPAPAKPQTPLSAEMGTIQPDQVQHALDDLEMLRDFNHLMRSGPPESKM